MDEKTSFEEFLFGDGREIVIDNMEFCVDRIVMLPKIRPHQLEKSVRLSVKYCELPDFRQKLLEKSNLCPVLIFQLHKRGILAFAEIEPFFRNRGTFMLSYYFRKEIKNFKSFIRSKDKPHDIDESFFENENDIDLYTEYGFLPSSIEYCFKYDVIDDLARFDNLNQNIRWSPFEWSYKPEYLDMISFAGFFGSIKCFKHLLLKGFEINEYVFSMVVCSGCFDLFHICQGQELSAPNLVCKASEFFHLPFLVFLIENGSDIGAIDKSSWSSLHYAALEGHLSVVEYLVNQKADINAKNKDDCAPLHLAAEKGHLSVVEYLVNQKADINSKNNHSWTPLHLAAEKGYLSVVEYLIHQGADFRDGINYQSYLHWASQHGHLSVVECLVNQKADINSKNNHSWTPLHLAAEKGHLSVVEYLIHQGADFRDGINYQSYLHWASQHGHLSVVECLVNQKADINAKDNRVEVLYLIGLLFI